MGQALGAERGMRLAIEQVVKTLPKQGKKATESLAELMNQLTLRQITAAEAPAAGARVTTRPPSA